MAAPTEKAEIKKDAWLAKGFAVLVKRNFNKGRLHSRDKHFAKLLRLLAGEDGDDGTGDEEKMVVLYMLLHVYVPQRFRTYV